MDPTQLDPGMDLPLNNLIKCVTGIVMDGRNTIAKFFTDAIQLDYLLFLKIIRKYIKHKVPTDISRFHLI